MNIYGLEKQILLAKRTRFSFEETLHSLRGKMNYSRKRRNIEKNISQLTDKIKRLKMEVKIKKDAKRKNSK